jgi:hypothetical protein
MAKILLSKASPADCPELSMEDWDSFYEMGARRAQSCDLSSAEYAMVTDPAFTPNEADDIQFWEKIEAYNDGFKSVRG